MNYLAELTEKIAIKHLFLHILCFLHKYANRNSKMLRVVKFTPSRGKYFFPN